MATQSVLKVKKHVLAGETVSSENFETGEVLVPTEATLTEGQVLVEVSHLSIDPWYLSMIKPGLYSWATPLPEGSVFSGNGVGKVMASKHPMYSCGDHVAGWFPFQARCAVDSAGLNKLSPGVTPTVALSLLGGPALTAFFGLEDVCGSSYDWSGKTVAVSAAAGSVGSIVGQLVLSRGARVVGFAGSDEKCEKLVNELGFTHGINYKAPAGGSLEAALEKSLGGDKVDVFWDNTYGPVAQAVYEKMAVHGRVILCGEISTYDTVAKGRSAVDPARMNHLILENRLRVEGILVMEYFGRAGEAIPTLVKLHETGSLKENSHVVNGFDSIVSAFLGLFAGHNTGKTIVAL